MIAIGIAIGIGIEGFMPLALRNFNLFTKNWTGISQEFQLK
jgi:hypothetical protein